MKPTETSDVGGDNTAGKRELPGAMGYMSNPPIIRPKKRKKPSGTLKL